MARTERAHGPYQHGQRWRVVVVSAGTRVVTSYETEGEAKAVVDAVKREIATGDRTIDQAIDEYELELKQRRGEDKKASVYTTLARLRALMPNRGRSVVSLSAARCAELYAKYSTSGAAVDTHRNSLAEAKTWGRWMVKQGWMRRNPWEGVEGIGRRKKGEKPQLRIDEARDWLRVAMVRADDGEDGAVAAMVALLCGLRSGEIVELRARDVDDGGRILWVADSKTPTGRRRLLVPDVLKPYLIECKRGKLPLAYLLGAHDRGWPTDWVKRLCALARVPIVTAHGQRGLNGTLAMDAGVSGVAVAASLGHASVSTTVTHYAEKGAIERSASAKTASALGTPDQGSFPSADSV